MENYDFGPLAIPYSNRKCNFKQRLGSYASINEPPPKAPVPNVPVEAPVRWFSFCEWRDFHSALSQTAQRSEFSNGGAAAFFRNEKLQEVEGRWQTLKRSHCIRLLTPVETIRCRAHNKSYHNLWFLHVLTLSSCILLDWNSPPVSNASNMKIMNREKGPNGLKLLKRQTNHIKHH